jgi:predicted NAD/FAD-dependent oxidoreductase
MSITRKTVAITGAGFAGAVATLSLALPGHSIHVIDKAGGAGGRLATRRVERAGREDLR